MALNCLRFQRHQPNPSNIIMTTTSSAPSSLEDAASPTSLIDEIIKLHAMSTSLAKGDWEITPVQAWFLLLERVGVERLTGKVGQENLDLLTARLSLLTRCFGFGAVMTKILFWDEVERTFQVFDG